MNNFFQRVLPEREKIEIKQIRPPLPALPNPILSRVVLVEVNGAVSKLKISECETLEYGETVDCLVLVYSIDDQRSFGKILKLSFLFLFFHFVNKKKPESRY